MGPVPHTGFSLRQPRPGIYMGPSPFLTQDSPWDSPGLGYTWAHHKLPWVKGINASTADTIINIWQWETSVIFGDTTWPVLTVLHGICAAWHSICLLSLKSVHYIVCIFWGLFLGKQDGFSLWAFTCIYVPCGINRIPFWVWMLFVLCCKLYCSVFDLYKFLIGLKPFYLYVVWWLD